MNATAILTDLTARGIRVWAEADRVKLDALAGTLTDSDRAELAAHKTELLEMLTRPTIGSINHPLIVRARQMPERCIFDECAGQLAGKGDLYKCDRCAWWFERRYPDPPGIYVGDL